VIEQCDPRQHPLDRWIVWGAAVTLGVIVVASLVGCSSAAADDGVPPGWDTCNRTQPAETKFHRRANIVGGEKGFTNASVWVTSEAGPQNLNYEWNLVAIMANSAPVGTENVAAYFQGLARGPAQTWAAVSEVKDESNGQSPVMVAHEFNVYTASPDNGGRVGAHVVLSGTGGGTDGLRISGNWTTAIQIDGTPQAVIAVPAGTERIPVRVGNRIRYIRLED
jgi:hypothetical protein